MSIINRKNILLSLIQFKKIIFLFVTKEFSLHMILKTSIKPPVRNPSNCAKNVFLLMRGNTKFFQQWHRGIVLWPKWCGKENRNDSTWGIVFWKKRIHVLSDFIWNFENFLYAYSLGSMEKIFFQIEYVIASVLF